jgi:hypothetical protein
MAELVESYLDLPLGIVDAAVVAIAERLALKEIATLDHRHFSVVRPRHVRAFSLLPSSRTAWAVTKLPTGTESSTALFGYRLAA